MGEPVTIAIPLIGMNAETVLINALESVMLQLATSYDAPDFDARARAADWLHSKYGSAK